MNAGDRVLVPGEVQMLGVGIEDEDVLVKLENGSFTVVTREQLSDWEPKAIPEHLAVVHKEDLRVVLDQAGRVAATISGQEARKRLRLAVDAVPPLPVPPWHLPKGWPLEKGDVWKDTRNGQLWFGVERRGEITLQNDSVPGVTVTGEALAELGCHLRLCWRNEP